MKRAQDKIKDYVEPQAFDEVQDVAADPARALAAYRFTDATSDLLARWLDALADLPRGHGAAHALAGLRGVGKSHTLAVFSALVSSPELRATVSDSHVAISSRRLGSRRYLIVSVRRGTRETLLEELTDAFSAAFNEDTSKWGAKPETILERALAHASGTTLVLIIDTAYGREARVSRDDGPILSALAVAAQDCSAFIALALDDDISGAEGVNVALARTFQIDYLEPEHLYHVANQYLLRKIAPARDALHEIYLALRNSVPGFNWSEPRFATLYPVHPLVADVSASVRLHAHKFAFLPFAANAALRAVNRPALSLILLDEVFDSTEDELRQSIDLKDAFAAYDQLATQGVSQFPAMQRLQVRLVLKNLFILSLDGRGATARDLCAALLLNDEVTTPASAIERIEHVLASLTELIPAGNLQQSDSDGSTRYCFVVSASGNFAATLTAAVENLPADRDALNTLLRTLARTRFEDWPLRETGDETNSQADVYTYWRGSTRRGRVARLPLVTSPDALSCASEYEWKLTVHDPLIDEAATHESQATEQSRNGAIIPFNIVWYPAALSSEELSILQRLVALRTTPALLDAGDTARAVYASLNAQAERIWARIYVDEGYFEMNGERLSLSGDARSATRLVSLLEQLLTPLFNARYPQHPQFPLTLSEADVARLVANFYGGANVADANTQQLVESFAMPLGLAAKRGEHFAPEVGDEVLTRAWVKETLALVDGSHDGASVSFDIICQTLRRPPYGLGREAQQLVVAALVAQRRVELLTASGDRISRRTLGRAIKWDEIKGIARAAAIHYNAEELTVWARLLTNHSELSSIADAQARERAHAALREWLENWHASALIEQFDQLPDSGQTLRAWNMASIVRRTFGEAAKAIEALLAGDVPLEESLQRVADAFGGKPETHAQSREQVANLSAFIEGLLKRDSARGYLAAAELTGVEDIESARRELLLISEDPHNFVDVERRDRFDKLWEAFRTRFAEHYAQMHERAIGKSRDVRALNQLTRSNEWREFEALSQLPFVNQQYWHKATVWLDQAHRSYCDLPVRQLLQERPACACAFRLARAEVLIDLASHLEELSSRGRATARQTITLLHKHLAHALNMLARDEAQPETTTTRLFYLAGLFTHGENPPFFTERDAQLMAHALEQTPAPEPLRVEMPGAGLGFLMRDELSARIQQWLDELPSTPALVEIVNESGSDGA